MTTFAAMAISAPEPTTRFTLPPGVQALGDDAIATLFADIMTYANFSKDIDPDNLHDMGVLSFSGTTVWFKIDSHQHDPDGRIFTLLLPEEN